MTELRGSAEKWPAVVSLIGAVIALLAFLELVDPWKTTLLWEEVFNFGHLPLFGLIGILHLRLVTLAWGDRLSVLKRYGLALLIAVSLGALSEIVQIGGPRDADIFDFLRDVVGSLSFLLVYFAYDSKTKDTLPSFLPRLRRPILLLTAFVLVGASAMTVSCLGIAWMERDQMFPVLLSFEHWWERPFWSADNATGGVVEEGGDGADAAGNHVLRLDYRASTYTGVILQDIYPDWRAYTTLSFSVRSGSSRTEQLRLRIDDFKARNHRDDRFERIIDIPPGKSAVTLPLADIQHGPPDGRELDLARIKRIVLFSASQPRREFSLWFDDFVLR